MPSELHMDMERYEKLAAPVKAVFDEWVAAEPIVGAVEIFVRGNEATIVTKAGLVRKQELRALPPENAMEISSFV